LVICGWLIASLKFQAHPVSRAALNEAQVRASRNRSEISRRECSIFGIYEIVVECSEKVGLKVPTEEANSPFSEVPLRQTAKTAPSQMSAGKGLGFIAAGKKNIRHNFRAA